MSSKRKTTPASAEEPTAKKMRAGRTSASTRLAFWTQFSTPLLFHWLNDFEAPDGVDWISEDDADDRDKIINLLVSTKGILAPEGEPLAALQAHWRASTGESTAKAPGMFVTGMTDANPPADTPPTPPPPRGGSAAKGSCSGCLTPFSINAKTGAVCLNPACGQVRADLPFEHIINSTARTAANIRNSGSGPQDGMPSQPRTTVGIGPNAHSAAGQESVSASQLTLTHTGDAAADLDARSVGLRDAAAAAAQRDYPSYSSREPMSVASALAISAQAVKASDYLAPSEGLIAYIRSGALSDISFALPIPAEAAYKSSITQRGHQEPTIAALLRQNRGVITAHRAATSLTDFSLAFAATIGPALIEQPMALAHWFAFYRSVIEIHTATQSWEETTAYIAKHLQTRIHRRESIGRDDQLISTRILLMAQRSFGSPAASSVAPATNQRQGNSVRGKGPQKPVDGQVANTAKKPCRFWNSAAGCRHSADKCSHAHVCNTCGKDHQASACSLKAKTRTFPAGRERAVQPEVE